MFNSSSDDELPLPEPGEYEVAIAFALLVANSAAYFARKSLKLLLAFSTAVL